ncbi:MAG: archease [Planctomycetia bacterium]|nr:archease [Planctomycetia bacterium]
MHEIVEHTADLGLRVTAPTLELLMADAACGLFEVIAGDLSQIQPQSDRAERFHVAGTDPMWLLFDWISELHAAFELRRMLFCSFDVTIDAAGLHATAYGEPYDPVRHLLAHEIKAITQHELSVVETAVGWEATLIVDI